MEGSDEDWEIFFAASITDCFIMLARDAFAREKISSLGAFAALAALSCSCKRRILNSTISDCLNAPITQAQLQMLQFGLPSVSVTEPLSLQAWHDVAAMHVP
jgi:hypothetical protein